MRKFIKNHIPAVIRRVATVNRATRAFAMTASLAVGCCLAACDPDRDVNPAQSPADASLAQKIDSLWSASMQDGTVPGMSVVVIKNGRTFFQKGYGYADLAARTPVTNDTRFAIGSTTKAMTAMAVLGLVDRGLVKLDERVTTYLPDFIMKDPRYKDIRVSQLLSHSSGIQSFTSVDELNASPETLEGILTVLAKEELAFAPGTAFYYSNYGTTLAGLLVQRVTKTPYVTYMRQALFDPIGMPNTTMEFWQPNALGGTKGYVLDAQNKPVEELAAFHRLYLPAGSGTISTATDVGRYLTTLLNQMTTTKGERLLSDSLTTRLFSGSVNADSDGFLQYLGATGSYSFGWYTINRNGFITIEHAGTTGTMLSSFVIDPKTKSAVAVLVNQQDVTKVAVAAEVARLVFSAQPR